MPFEMVDDALAATRTVERRLRLVPARVTVHLLLAGTLFAELGYRQVLCTGWRAAPDRAVARRGRHANVWARRC